MSIWVLLVLLVSSAEAEHGQASLGQENESLGASVLDQENLQQLNDGGQESHQTQALVAAAKCCHKKWGNKRKCADYPASGNGPLCRMN